jgi:hypothetical protein
MESNTQSPTPQYKTAEEEYAHTRLHKKSCAMAGSRSKKLQSGHPCNPNQSGYHLASAQYANRQPHEHPSVPLNISALYSLNTEHHGNSDLLPNASRSFQSTTAHASTIPQYQTTGTPSHKPLSTVPTTACDFQNTPVRNPEPSNQKIEIKTTKRKQIKNKNSKKKKEKIKITKIKI